MVSILYVGLKINLKRKIINNHLLIKDILLPIDF